MASQLSSQASRSSNKNRRRRTTCFCGERPVLRTSSTAENPGRRFWGCINYQIGEECEFFAWAEPDGQDLQIQKFKRKITLLKEYLRKAEQKFAVAIAVGTIGWLIALFLLYERHSYARHMRLP